MHRLLFALFVSAPMLLADDGWLIERFEAQLEIGPDGAVVANEMVYANFKNEPHHGIYRDLSYRFDYDQTNIREYGIELIGVTSLDGRRHKVQVSNDGGVRRFKIGDPDRTITGKETYRIAYRLKGAINGFADHDELYLNATGVWTVPVQVAFVRVIAPTGSLTRADCFQGERGSTERCLTRLTENEATFTATRPLVVDEQMTIVAGLRKGAVTDTAPRLVAKPRTLQRAFELTPLFGTVAWAGLVVAIGGVGFLWWTVGRDRRYVALHRSSADAVDERVPLFGARPIAVEFQPPDHIRPAQVGLIIDERADTLDMTATIVDLAVRGYLKITELPKQGWFDRRDWQLERLGPADDRLLRYERIILDGLFERGDVQELSDLKQKFHGKLNSAKTALYSDAVDRGWFPRNPNAVRGAWAFASLVIVALGIFLTIYLGRRWGAGLLGLPVVIAGLLLMLMSSKMPRRTAAGSDVLARTLGFARYVKTAEVHQQAFAERAQIFTEYLPFAIAFKYVDRWARAFKDIDMQQATAHWYTGGTGFNAGSFSSTLGSFSSSVSNTIASTPGGSGGSGFSGGSSGGGGGGGGGGGW